MHIFFKLLVSFLIALKLGFFGSMAWAAQPECELFKTMAPVLDVLKKPPENNDYIAVLKQNDIVCIKQKRKIGKRIWGHISHQVLPDGKQKSMKGWVGLRFMAPHKERKTAVPLTKKLPLAKATSQKDAFNAAKAQNTAEGWQYFIGRYPNGFRKDLARAYLSNLKRNPTSGPTKRRTTTTTNPQISNAPKSLTKRALKPRTYEGEAEIMYWNSVRESDDAAIVRLYLKKYPQGSFVDLANAMLRKLENNAGSSRDGANTRRAKKKESKARQKVRTRSQPSKSRTRDTQRSKKKKQYKRRAETKKNRSRPRRRSPRCRQETNWECVKRGGRFELGGCLTQRVCK
jgi:hypothetical protein